MLKSKNVLNSALETNYITSHLVCLEVSSVFQLAHDAKDNKHARAAN